MNVQTRVIAARVMGVQAAGALYGKANVTDIAAATAELANELAVAEAALAQSRVEVCSVGRVSISSAHQVRNQCSSTVLRGVCMIDFPHQVASMVHVQSADQASKPCPF